MMDGQHFFLRDDCEIWLQDIMDTHYEEALSRANSVLSQTTEDENGCWVTSTQGRPKTRFKGRQVASARFVYCVVAEDWSLVLAGALVGLILCGLGKYPVLFFHYFR